MRLVPIKSENEQARLCVHRVRRGIVEQRTATINHIPGLLSAFGIDRGAAAHLENQLGWANTAVGDSSSEVHRLDERLAEYDRIVDHMAGEDECSRRLEVVRRPRLGHRPVLELTPVCKLSYAADNSRYRSVDRVAAESNVNTLAYRVEASSCLEKG